MACSDSSSASKRCKHKMYWRIVSQSLIKRMTTDDLSKKALLSINHFWLLRCRQGDPLQVFLKPLINHRAWEVHLREHSIYHTNLIFKTLLFKYTTVRKRVFACSTNLLSFLPGVVIYHILEDVIGKAYSLVNFNC